MTRNLVAVSTIIALAGIVGCTVKQTETPPLTGPSGMALSVTVNATPDSILQDGASQSSVVVTAIKADGSPLSGQTLRLSMSVNGVAQDFGTLAARTVVTGSDGKATTIYTAPPAPPALAGGSGSSVSIVATPIGTDSTTSPVHGASSVLIRLVPPGVILPPAGTPTARFTFTPTPVNFNIPVTFDASTSCAGGATDAGCSSTNSTITTYQWTFGDGGTGSGRTATHTYTQSTTPATGFSVTLTVTNDRGVSASSTQQVQVSASPAPTGDWVFSPTSPIVGDSIFFNADSVRPAAGHTIVQYTWNFGDQTPTQSGFQTTHVFTTAGTYQVVLSVRDDADQKATFTKAVTIASGKPVPAFTVSPTSPKAGVGATFDASATQTFGGSPVVTFQWNWGDGTGSTQTSTPTTSHTFAAAGVYTVTLIVTDDKGRQGVATSTVTVTP